MYKIIMIILLAVVNSSAMTPAYATQLSGKDKKDFIKSGVRACINSQRQNPLSKNISDVTLNEYCNCTMAKVADSITVEILASMVETKNTEFMRPITDNAAYNCAQKLLKKQKQ